MKDKRSKEKFFEEFSPVDKEGWIQKVVEDQKDQRFEKLIWSTLEDIEVAPFYTSEDQTRFNHLKAYQHNFGNFNNPAYPARNWTNYEGLDIGKESMSNPAALQALNAGADGLLFNIGSSEINFKALLKNVELPYCQVSFKSGSESYDLIAKYLNYSKTVYGDLSILNGFYDFDSIANWTKGSQLKPSVFSKIGELLRQTGLTPGFKPLSIQGHHFHESGANIVQEIAFILNTVVEYFDKLTESETAIADIVGGIQVSLSIGSNYFMEIAKLRAIRILYHQLIKAYGLTNFQPADLQIHCTTSYWTKTIYDPETNLLRNTTEAMAAILGGCNSIMVDPHDLVSVPASTFSRRIARNISSILKEESYLDKIVDPAAGSYYLENLTGEIAQHSWDLFQEIEEKGGFIKAFEKNIIQEKIKTVRQKRHQNVARQKTIIVGTNQYSDPKDIVSEFIPAKQVDVSSNATGYEYLSGGRASKDIENLRIKTVKISNELKQSPSIIIVNMGNDKTQKVRSGFVRSFFNSSGFKTTAVDLKDDFQHTINDVLTQPGNVVVMCGSDEKYREKALPFTRSLKATAPKKLLYIAGRATELEHELLKEGLHGKIYLHCDMVETIESIHHFLLSEAGKEVNIS